MEVWLGGSSESVGGIRRKTIPTPNAAIDVQVVSQLNAVFDTLSIQDQLNSIILIHGIWTFGKPRFAGFVSVNNFSITRELYYDISLEIFPKNDVDDLIQLFWESENYEAEGVISEFATNMRVKERGTSVEYDLMMFSIGPPDPHDISTFMAVNTGGDGDLIGFMYDTMITRKESIVQSHIKRGFLLKPVKDSQLVAERLQASFQEAVITVKQGGSVTFIARNRDSFEKLYTKFLQDVFTPIFNELEKDSQVEERIKKGLQTLERKR